MTRMMLDERRFPRLVGLVAGLRRRRGVAVAMVVAGIIAVFLVDMLTTRWFVIAGFYLVPLSLSAVVLRVRPTFYLSLLCLVLSGAVSAAEGVPSAEALVFLLFELLACVGLLVLAHLLNQVDSVSRRAGMRARFSEAVADIAGMSGRGEAAQDIVGFALESIRQETGADLVVVLRLRDGLWEAEGARGSGPGLEHVKLPYESLPDAIHALSEDAVTIGRECLPLLDGIDEKTAGAAQALAELRSCLTIPLRALGEDLGVILLGRRAADVSYSPDQVRFAESIAGYTGASLEGARLARELAARERDLSLVVESSLDFASSLELRDVLRAVTKRLMAALDVVECDIYSVDLEQGVATALVGADTVEPSLAARPGKEYQLSLWSSSERAVRTGTAVAVHDTDSERLTATERDYFATRGFTGLLCVPLKARDRVIGLIELFDRHAERRFTDADIALAEAVCQFAGLAIDNASLYADQRATAERNDRLIAQLQRLMGVALRLNHLQTQPDTQRLLDAAVRSAAGLLDVHRVALVSVLEDGLTVHALYDADLPAQETTAVGLSTTDSAQAVPLWLRSVRELLKAGQQGLSGPTGAALVRDRLVVAVSSSYLGESSFLVCADKKRGGFGAEDELLTRTLAIQLAASLVNAATFQREYQIAETLQNALQSELPHTPGVDVGLRYQAATAAARVGGDFYDVVSLGPGRLMVCVGDVCGKGLQAAAQTALVRYMLRAYVGESSPGESLSRLNSTIMTQEEGLPFVTLLVAYIDVPRRLLEFSLAGHPRPVVVSGGKKVPTPDEGGFPIGLFRGAVYPTERLVLPPDVTIVMHTDGLVEARRDRKLYGERRLAQAVRRAAGGAAQEVAEDLMLAVQRYTGGVLEDDAAVVVIRMP